MPGERKSPSRARGGYFGQQRKSAKLRCRDKQITRNFLTGTRCLGARLYRVNFVLWELHFSAKGLYYRYAENCLPASLTLFEPRSTRSQHACWRKQIVENEKA